MDFFPVLFSDCWCQDCFFAPLFLFGSIDWWYCDSFDTDEWWFIGLFGFLCSQYLAELLAEHQKLGPFMQVLPICNKLLSQGEILWSPPCCFLQSQNARWEFSLVTSELFICNHELGTDAPQCLDEYSVWLALDSTSMLMIFGPRYSLCFVGLDLYCQA